MTENGGGRIWTIEDGVRIKIAERLYLSFQRTRRVEPSAAAVAPKSYGVAPVSACTDAGQDRLIVPLPEEEGLWLGLSAVDDDVPSAVRVIVREPVEIDATTGLPPLENLQDAPQNYVVVPPQHVVAGVYVAEGRARQFVRTSHSDKDAPCERIEVKVHVPTRRTAKRSLAFPGVLHQPEDAIAHQGVKEAEGFVLQQIVRDGYGIDLWSVTSILTLNVEFATPRSFAHLTGRPAPPPLTDESTYGGWRLP